MSRSEAISVTSSWLRPQIALAAVLLGILLLYAHTALGMVQIWARSDTYAHGFLVPVISGWLIWRARSSLGALEPVPSRSAWLLMLGGAALWLAGDLVAVNAATQLALVCLLVLAVPAVLGWHVAWAMAFPLGFLFFAVPLGDFMLPRLMEWTADFTVLALRWSAIPVYREGLYFVIPSGTWSVVEACSGIRYLIASVTVGSLFAYLSYRSLKKRLVFIGVAILVPLLANWLRAYLIVMVGHHSGNELATGVDHLIYGWVFFGVVIFIMLMIGMRWADAPGSDAAGESQREPAGAVAPQRGAVSSVFAALVVLLVCASPHLVEQLISLGTRTQAVQMVRPAPQTPWRAEAAAPSAWQPSFPNPSATLHLGFIGPQSEVVGLHVSYYRQQDYTRKLVGSQNVLVTSEDEQWLRGADDSAQAILNGTPMRVSSTVLTQRGPQLNTGGQRLAVWRFYWVNNQFTASDTLAKLQGALGRLTGKGDDGAIVVVYTPLTQLAASDGGQAAAQATLQAFLQAHGAAIEASLNQTRGAP